MDIDSAALKSWTQGDLTRVEELLTELIIDPVLHAHALAQRALVRSRLKQTDLSVVDAKKVSLCHLLFDVVLTIPSQVYRSSAICHRLYCQCSHPHREWGS